MSSGHIMSKKRQAGKALTEAANTKNPSIEPRSKNLINIKLWLPLIILATIIAYSPVFFNSLVWDDAQYISNNPLIGQLSFSNIQSMFFGEHAYFMGNYHPLTILSLAVDCRILHAGKASHIWIFHLTNLVLHSLNTLMVFWLVYALFLQLKNRFAVLIALAASLLFGVHALHVESVAWIAERKDVLYAFFFLSSLIAYVRHLAKSNYLWLAASLLCFIFSLLSKGQAVSLAVTLFAVDFIWGRKVFSLKTFIEKIPFVTLSAAFGIIAIKAQMAGNAVQEYSDYRSYERALIASYGFIMYLVKLILPIGLSAYYPYTHGSGDAPLIYYFSLLLVAAIAVVLFRSVKRNKEIAFGISFFVLNVILVLQWMPIGSAIMADRYSYVPSIGFFILAAVGYAKLISKSANVRRMAKVSAAAYVAILMVLTFTRAQVWANDITLWTDATTKEPMGSLAWNNLGKAKMDAGNYTEAVAAFDAALNLNSKYAMAYVNRGTAKKNIGDSHADAKYWREAIEDYNKAIEMQADFSEAYFSRGLVKGQLSDIPGEIEDYNKAIKLNYKDPKIYLNLGTALGKAGKINEAIASLDKALSIDPNWAEAYDDRGSVKFQASKYQDAIKDYNKAIAIKPDLSEALYNRGLAKNELKDYKDATNDFNRALSQKPDFYQAYLSRGVSYMELRQYPQALSDYDKAISLAPSWASPFYEKYEALRKMKSQEQACQYLNKAIELGANEMAEYGRYCGSRLTASK
jgi:tetratricopeptide (TPR) repeat protein